MTLSVSEAQRQGGSKGKSERSLFGRTLNTKDKKIRESRSITKAKKKLESKEKKRDKEYAEFVKSSRKRAVKIQSPEVQARMIENRKQADINYKTKRKESAVNSKKAGRKYKR